MQIYNVTTHNMTNLIPKEKRVDELIRFGAPKLFIKNIGNVPELEFRVENTDGAYFYLPQILDYKIIRNQNIIPIFSCGESFYVFTFNKHTERIIHFELENDAIYTDYGNNWNVLLMDIMIQYFEDKIDNGIENDDFKRVGKKIGFHKSENLFKLLNIPIEEYNNKYDQKEKWRIEIAKELEIL